MWLCIGLVAIFALYNVAPVAAQNWTLKHLALIPVLFYTQLQGGLDLTALLPLISYNFLHHDWMHVLINAAMLLAFGSLIERHIGTSLFLSLFILCGVGGGVAQLLMTGPQVAVVLGASAGAYGAIGAAVPLLFSGNLATTRKRALIFIAVIMGLNRVLGLFGGGLLTGGAAIAWQSHLGGFITGLLLMTVLRRLNWA